MRFTVDDRVRCRVGPIEWAAGRVTMLHFREPSWPQGRVVPYQIELDTGELIFAPSDSDHLIRSEAVFDKLAAEEARESEAVSRRYREDVIARYPRLHAALFEPTELARFLDPKLHAALQLGDEAALRALWTEEARGLYSLPFFTAEYCTLFLEECDHFEAWCAASDVVCHRPNTMNNYGVVVDDFGMGQMMQELLRQCVQPLATLAGYADVGGDDLQTHHAFVVACAPQPGVDAVSDPPSAR
jgi:hypothetical protein